MHILFYSDSDVYGGHEQMLMNFLTFNRFNVDISVIVSSCNVKFISKLEQSDVKVVQIEHASKSFNFMRTIIFRAARKKLLKVLDDLKPDIIVLCQGMVELSILPLLLKKKLKIPIISYIPQTAPLVKTGAKLGFIRDKLNILLYKNIDAFLTISQFSKSNLTKYHSVNDGIIYVIENGVYIDEGLMKAHSVERIDNNLRLLSLGRFDSNKQQDKLIEIFCNGFGDNSSVTLDVVGGGDLNYVNKIYQLSKGVKNIRVIEWVDEPLKLIAKYDFLVIFSKFEGVPLVALESMSLGLGVISRNLEYTDVYDGLDGFYIFSNNSEFLSVVRELISTKKGGAHYQNLALKIYENNDIEKKSRDFFNVIMEVCNESKKN